MAALTFDPDIRVLTVRQPSAWLIVHGYKDIENRSRPLRYRGQILILASASLSPVFADVRKRCAAQGIPLPAAHEIERGGIVGLTHAIGCVEHSDNPWFEGPYGWQLANSRTLPFVAQKGMLAMFRPSRELLTLLSQSRAA